MSESNPEPGEESTHPDDVEATDASGHVERAHARGQLRGAQGGRGAQDEAFEADERSREALAFTTDVIEKMGMDCDVSLQPPEPESSDTHIVVTGPDAGRIIGKKGQVLAALQFIVNRAMNL